jgi:hypothetical protein
MMKAQPAAVLSRAVPADSDALLQSLVHTATQGDFDARENLYSRIIPSLIESGDIDLAAVLADLRAKSPALALRFEAHLRAEADLMAAYRWAESLPYSTDRTLVLASILYQAGHDAPREAIELASTCPLDDMKFIVMKNVVLEWSDRHPREAHDWLEAQRPEAWRDTTLAMLPSRPAL